MIGSWVWRARKRCVIAVAILLNLGVVNRLHGTATAAIADHVKLAANMQTDSKAARPGVCERNGEKLEGQKPIRVGRSVRAPKKLRNVSPNYPKLPPGTVGTGMWLGEVLISDSGKITHVWPIREVEFRPLFPPFNNAITEAIRQWEFEPVLVQGRRCRCA
jgi:hypothetical protein